MATALFPCRFCGRTYDLVPGDIPIGTASELAHYAEFGCDDPQTFEIAGPEQSPPDTEEQHDTDDPDAGEQSPPDAGE